MQVYSVFYTKNTIFSPLSIARIAKKQYFCSMIRFYTDGVGLPHLDEKRLTRWISSVAADYGFSLGDINYIFCSDERILEVNRQFLGHDYYTDIITFDYSTADRIAGDIYISLQTVESNSKEFAETNPEMSDAELHRILIHGILHLTGQADKTPETRAEMTRKEDLALAKLI